MLTLVHDCLLSHHFVLMTITTQYMQRGSSKVNQVAMYWGLQFSPYNNRCKKTQVKDMNFMSSWPYKNAGQNYKRNIRERVNIIRNITIT